MLAAAIGDLILKESSKATVEAYKSLVDTAFPFASKLRGNTDQEMVTAMKKEATKGVIQFTPIATPNPLQTRAKELRLPDDFRQKLQQRKVAVPQRARMR